MTDASAAAGWGWFVDSALTDENSETPENDRPAVDGWVTKAGGRDPHGERRFQGMGQKTGSN